MICFPTEYVELLKYKMNLINQRVGEEETAWKNQVMCRDLELLL